MAKGYRSPPVPNTMAAEKLRVFSAHTTTQILKRYGDRLGMWAGAGFPKSGTVWLCQLVAGYLDLPFAQNPHLPVAMPSVVHGHWAYDARFPRTVYVVRDGRDVMVSKYFHFVRQMDGRRNPRAAVRMKSYFDEVLGHGFDPQDAQANLAKFMERELTNPLFEHQPWPEHVQTWLSVEADRVGVVRYEDLLDDVATALAPVLAGLLDDDVDLDYLRMTADRFSFARRTGRDPGSEDRDEFLRKGVAGDWRTTFDDDAREVFDRLAGSALRAAGYDDD